ncbi:hypothetical protein EYZ11_001902 [Aspergillus tanneri]|uniref:glycogenin glucosyltransferase n=1 Tax=Aspergillus tanneri TaxID=1220188 RepID=A0A4V3UQE2_9EURO|nr:hypothetical protein EYZ11_001902 [Aspergillus tanneri]
MSSEGNGVYCTLLLSDHYLPGAVVLAHSLRDNGTKAKLIVLYPPDTLQPATIQELRTVYDELIPVHPMTNNTPANLWLMERPDLISTFTKIELWRQTQFRRIVYIDCDVVALRAPDELLELEMDFAAAPDVGWPDCFNSGVMVLRPNLQDYFALKGLAERDISFDGADQGLLNIHFKDWHRLSFTYNCTPSANYQYIPAYRHFQSTINLVHFIGSQKPWNMSRQVAPTESPYNELLGRWWAIYDRHYHPVAAPTHLSRMDTTSAPPPGGLPACQTDLAIKSSLMMASQATPSGQDLESFETEPVGFPELPWEQSSVSQPVTWSDESNSHRVAQARDFPTGNIKHIEQRILVQKDNVPTPLNVTEPQVSKQTGECISREEQSSTPRPGAPVFEPPKAEWDASREPPPLNTKPEGIALEKKTYTMSEDKQLFQPPESYPEAPKNMYYDLPSSKPEPKKLTQIFPWENHMPKPTRVFINDEQSNVSLPSPSSTRISRESLKEDWGPSMEPTIPCTSNEPTESWENYSRSNAWDEVPEILRYIQSIQQARKARVQVISDSDSSAAYGAPSQTITESNADTPLTLFPSELGGPRLPVTPAPIRRSSYFNVLEEDSTADKLPTAKGVPDQEEWVGITADVFLSLLRATYLYWAFTESVDTSRRASSMAV